MYLKFLSHIFHPLLNSSTWCLPGDSNSTRLNWNQNLQLYFSTVPYSQGTTPQCMELHTLCMTFNLLSNLIYHQVLLILPPKYLSSIYTFHYPIPSPLYQSWPSPSLNWMNIFTSLLIFQWSSLGPLPVFPHPPAKMILLKWNSKQTVPLWKLFKWYLRNFSKIIYCRDKVQTP